jgi:signal transduction histidine kinase/CheY-like chemotaxis protein
VSGERILVADDEPDVLDLCHRILFSEGYQVESVRDGYEAVKRAKFEHFDLLLTDIRMPGLNGLETAQAIKSFDPDIVCVTMTGFSSMDAAIEALKLGVDEFVVKPFTSEELSLAVARALEKERLRKENVRLRALIPLFEFNKTLSSTVNVDELLQQVMQVAQKETKADRVLLYLLDKSEELRLHGQFSSQPPPGDALEVGRELAQRCVKEQTQVVVGGDVPSSPALAEIAGWLHAQALIANPLVAQTQVIGAIILLKEGPGSAFASSDPEFLSVLAGQAATAIENARLFAETQRAYEELKQLDRMKSEFINIAAHELRTPLAILMGYASLLEEESAGSQRHSLEIILRNAMKLRSLIDDMLNLRYLETGQTHLKPEEVNLCELIEEAFADLSPLAESKGHTVYIDAPRNFPTLIADRQKISLVMVNLISNAIKFTNDGGTITVTARLDGDQAIVSVIDSGIGIPSGELERIFERFYQVEDSLTREHEGIGLGLAIVKGMVELCGGKIWVESALGVGSTFSFSIPLHLGQTP